MSTHHCSSPDAGRRPWVEPSLTRHESLTALTRRQQQQFDPTPAPEDNPALDSAMRALAVPGSQGFFP
ncbi:MAG TPA: hypothetical protein VKA84_02425 [Gemmatimonadaceae bacterium]|nr:hypothetical protein [Gemmatimonadaceae bacterium]